jgi:sigma-B regulation protein RsbU (phosphoserine phosphatase)
MTRELAIIEKLEKDISLKQLQIRSLLTITQAINDNVSQHGLFDMYRSFLSWEMGIERMALLVYSDGGWYCACDINSANIDVDAVMTVLKVHKRLHTIKLEDDRIIQDFNIIIPVMHKDYAIAYSLIGGIKEKEDLYNKIQFITTITNIISVAIENKRLFKRQLEQQKLERELEVAQEVQSLLIPKDLTNHKQVELAKIYKPHLNIGGDYIDYIRYDENRFALCIADISGKGVAAALLMANFQAIIQSLIFQYRDLETFVFALNQAVFRITRGDRFITFFVCEIDAAKKTMRYVNAGHFPPILMSQEGAVQRLDKGSTVIGAFDKLPKIQEGHIVLGKGDILLCYTDGIGELKNEQGELFEEKVMVRFLEDNKHKSAASISQGLEMAVNDFANEVDFLDDIAVLLCKLV